MTKKIFGILSVLIVIFAIVIFLFPPETATSNSKKVTSKPTEAKQNATATKAPVKKEVSDLPAVSTTDWQLILVNRDHAVKAEPTTLTSMKNSYQIDERIFDAYYEMEAGALAAGFSLAVLSSYRSIADQQAVYDADVNKYLATGLSQEEAEAKTEEYVTYPGNSEHHTGLAVDVVDQGWYDQGNGLEEGFFETDAGKWLDQNCANYGFIVRYPKNKESITGINYEPWHLRYVGKESAKYIVDHQLVLEEYLEALKKAGK